MQQSLQSFVAALQEASASRGAFPLLDGLRLLALLRPSFSQLPKYRLLVSFQMPWNPSCLLVGSPEKQLYGLCTCPTFSKLLQIKIDA